LRQFHVYSHPGRDPRQHSISTVFTARGRGTPKARDDAQAIGLFDKDNLPSPLVFDHRLILEDYFAYRESATGMKDVHPPRNLDLENLCSHLREKIPEDTRLGIVLGTGLGGLVDHIQKRSALSYEDLPGFPRSTVPSHQGQLIWGTLAGKKVVALQGRFHLYEGYSPQAIAFPIRVLASLGIRVLIVSNAAGGLDPLFQPGDLMVISDHINYTGENPLVGPHEEAWGERFPDMSRVYDRDLLELTRRAALDSKIPLRQGIYLGLKGPSLETPAETRFLRNMGASAVGMSTIMEVIVAVQSGLRILGLSVITNVNRPDCMEPASLETIIETARRAEPQLAALVKGILKRLSL
jgi:purine-nucleoside phosphorylase